MNSLYLGIIFIFMSILSLYSVIDFTQTVLCAFSISALLASVNDVFKLLISKSKNSFNYHKVDENGYLFNNKGVLSKKYNIKDNIRDRFNLIDLIRMYVWIGNSGGIVACSLIVLTLVLIFVIFAALLQVNNALWYNYIPLVIILCILIFIIKNKGVTIIFDFLVVLFIVIPPHVSSVKSLNFDNINKLVTIWTLAGIFITIYLKENIKNTELTVTKSLQSED